MEPFCTQQTSHGGSTRPGKPLRLLELGAGTGLAGLAASSLFHVEACLTDLETIVPNLQHNIDANKSLIKRSGSTVTARDLDWSAIHTTILEKDRYDIILAADSLYTPEHATWLASTMKAYLGQHDRCRVFVSLPFRETEPGQHGRFREEMERMGFEVVDQGEERGFEDWETHGRTGGERVEVRCWWSMWRRRKEGKGSM